VRVVLDSAIAKDHSVCLSITLVTRQDIQYTTERCF